jgi:hypothetical protein
VITETNITIDDYYLYYPLLLTALFLSLPVIASADPQDTSSDIANNPDLQQQFWLAVSLAV